MFVFHMGLSMFLCRIEYSKGFRTTGGKMNVVGFHCSVSLSPSCFLTSLTGQEETFLNSMEKT